MQNLDVLETFLTTHEKSLLVSGAFECCSGMERATIFEKASMNESDFKLTFRFPKLVKVELEHAVGYNWKQCHWRILLRLILGHSQNLAILKLLEFRQYAKALCLLSKPIVNKN